MSDVCSFFCGSLKWCVCGGCLKHGDVYWMILVSGGCVVLGLVVCECIR